MIKIFVAFFFLLFDNFLIIVLIELLHLDIFIFIDTLGVLDALQFLKDFVVLW